MFVRREQVGLLSNYETPSVLSKQHGNEKHLFSYPSNNLEGIWYVIHMLSLC
jgi:hypothetical protein